MGEFAGTAKVGDLHIVSVPSCKKSSCNSYLEHWVLRKSGRIRVTKKDYTSQFQLYDESIVVFRWLLTISRMHISVIQSAYNSSTLLF